MEGNAVDQDDIDFSIISPGNDRVKQLDFSVNELLQNRQTISNSLKQIPPESPSQQQILPQGSFMKDLQKMQKSLSYETNPYDIYEPSEQLGEFTGTFEAKQEDTCTNPTNNMTKLGDRNFQADFRHLIVDFTEDRIGNFRTKESFQDCFEGDILTTKKLHEKVLDKDQANKSKNKGHIPIKLSQKLKTVGSEVSLKSKERSPSHESKILSKVSSKKTLPIPKSPTKTPTPKPLPPKQKPNPLSTPTPTSKSKSKSKLTTPKKFTSPVPTSPKHREIIQKHISKVQSEVYSEYFGFETEVRKESIEKKKKGGKKSNSKGKKIVYSNRNVHLYH